MRDLTRAHRRALQVAVHRDEISTMRDGVIARLREDLDHAVRAREQAERELARVRSDARMLAVFLAEVVRAMGSTQHLPPPVVERISLYQDGLQ